MQETAARTNQPGGPPPAEPFPPDMSYVQLFGLFLRFGFLAFGGPVAQIAMIRRELVDEAGWISSLRFNRLLSVMQMLPGPEAHELCVHMGIRAKGRLGGLLAGLGFMLPGFVLMLGLAWAYTSFALNNSVMNAIFTGVQAAVIALIVRAMHRIGQHILIDRWLWLVAGLAFVASLLGISFWIVLPAAGLSYAFWMSSRHMAAISVVVAAAILGFALEFAILPSRSPALAEPGVIALFLSGLKGGLLTFGGAYTAIPFIRNDTVGRGWMSDAQFLDGLGLSGMIPAPLVIFATFVGWVSGGLAGALAITAGMFLPAFAFSLLFYEHLEALAEEPRLRHFLEGVAAAVVALIAATLIDLARAAQQKSPEPWLSLLIMGAALVILYRWKSRLASLWVVLGGGVAGSFFVS